jgi:DNA-binding NarL/FixJ family response regulator
MRRDYSPGTFRAMWKPKRSVTIDLAPWPYLERPRVLIEHSDPDTGLDLAIAIRRAGCTVAICRGPDPSADPATRCPLHRLEPCVVVEGADLVVTALDLEGEEGRDVLRGLRTRYPSTPLVVAATVGEALELGDLLEGCTVVPVDAPAEQLVAAVLDALPGNGRVATTRTRFVARQLS